VLTEAEQLVKAGVKELLVISQDTSAYGLDVRYKPETWRGTEYETRFLDLAKGLGSLGVWTRMHYVYPYPHVDAVIPMMAEGLITPYLDIPFQHAAANVLKAMKRPAKQDRVLERIQQWRRDVPDLAIRSTFIVGFPGETDEDFRNPARLHPRGENRSRRLLPVRERRYTPTAAPCPATCRTR
jgi:ribosomal protein S12 methylthiotransferase